MRTTNRLILICLLAILMLFSVSCAKDVNSEVSDDGTNKQKVSSEDISKEETKQEVFTFTPQKILPIEDNPFILSIEISEQSENLTSSFDFDGEIGSFLESPVGLLVLEGQSIIDQSHYGIYDSGEGEKNFKSQENYVRYSTQNSETGFYFFDYIKQYTQNINNENFALLYKIRPSETNECIQFMMEFEGVRTEMNIYVNKYLEFRVSKNNTAVMSGGETEFRLNSDEWYNVLISFDKEYNYSYLMWQDTDPSKHVYKTYNLSALIDATYEQVLNTTIAEISFFTQEEESQFDIERLMIFQYEQYAESVVNLYTNDNTNTNTNDENNSVTYANDYEKYQLAVDFFNSEDYYNAYILLAELNGYSTSQSYLDECERLLQTIEIENQDIANAIGKVMNEQGMTIYDYFYVYQAEKIESLDLSKCKVEELSFLENFPSLKELNLDNNGISDLIPLKDLYELVRLSLAENNITDLFPLCNLTNLEFLDLRSNIISDVQPLGNLKFLKELDLSFNNIYTLSGLYTLESLEKVDLSYNFICSVNALCGSDIKELNILNTNICSLSAVANFSYLESLTAGFKLAHQLSASNPNEQAIFSKYKQGDGSVWAENFRGLEYIQGFENLKYLELARLEAGDEEDNLLPLTTLSSLEVLKFFRYNGPSGVEILGKLTNLTELTLDTWMYGFDDLSFLPKLTKLKKFEGPPMPTLSLIGQLESLEELRINGHIDSSLDFLSELKELKLLAINSEPAIDILDFSPLGELENLEYLHISMQNPPWDKNKPGFTPKNIEKAFGLGKLEYLDIGMWQKNLESIEGIQNLQNLKYLNLSFNSCSDSRIVDEAKFENLDSMILTEIEINEGANRCQYRLGYLEDKYVLQKPGDGDSVTPQLLWFDINEGTENDYFLQERYGHSQNIVVEFWIERPEFYDEEFTLIVPKGVRNLFIFNPSQNRIRLNIDATECDGLEWLVVGGVLMEGGSSHYGNKYIIEDLDGLAGCANLKELYINSAEVNDISGLAGCDKLKIVQLSGNNITDILALTDKMYLKEVDLSGNKISNMEVLESCLRLQ